MIRKWVTGLGIIFGFVLLLEMAKTAEGTHTFGTNANNITAGTLNSARLDPSSVTLQGNTFNGAGQLLQLNASGLVPSTLLSGSSATRVVDVVIGSPTATGVDIATNTEDGLKVAVQSICGSSNAVNCSGGSIFFRTGVYTIQDATIPYNVKVFAVPGSSVVWIPRSTTIPIVTVYGELEGITIDFNHSPFANYMIAAKSGSTIRRNTVDNADNGATGGGGNQAYGIFVAQNSTNTRIEDNRFLRTFCGTAYHGLIDVFKSSQTIVRNNVFENDLLTSFSGVVQGGANPMIGVEHSTSVLVTGNVAWRNGGRFVLVDGGKDIIVSENKANMTTATGSSLFAANTLSGPAISSTVWFRNNEVIVTAPSDNSIVFISDDALTSGNVGNMYDGNMITCTGTNTTVGFKMNAAGVVSTVLRNNTTKGCATFLTDSGSNTKSASLGNVKDATAQ